MKQIVTIDIGGTHARFAIADVDATGAVTLGEATTFLTNHYPSLERAWSAYADLLGQPLPKAVAISFAGPVHGDVLKLTNSSWLIRRADAGASLGVETATLVNDFAAIGHALAHVPADQLKQVCGPDVGLPELGTISIIGPGTGLGVAHVLRTESGYHVNETEGGHMDFSPLDAIEDQIVAALRVKFGRVSAERVIAGPGLRNIYDVIAQGDEHRKSYDDDTLWGAALDGTDSLAVVALDRFCLSLGALAGDVVLAQGGSAVVIGGGNGLRLAERLAQSGFALRFVSKGRFQAYMSAIPVKVLTHPQPGLLGAAAAYVVEHGA
ncbi:glucokinase [Rhizorhabdus argentea]|uniref:glucokinase n=1 Tax=Rhizorhabdus argentea TaxID=1387174 RepID=UPI0030EB220F